MINTNRLRAMLGWLGILLPWLVLTMSMAYGFGFPDSISATYYVSTCITPFMIILGSAGFLLISYKGYELKDDIVCTIAGIFGLLICIFPCKTEGLNLMWSWIPYMATSPVGTFNLPANISGIIHNISAIGFFGLLAYNSLFLFTLSSGNITEKKKKRNIIYRVCGIGMVVALAAIVPVSVLNIWGGIWFIEAIALAFFGISWLTKSEIYSWLYAEK